MYDLMLSINGPESKKSGIPIVEAYYVKELLIGKSGKYKGGSINAADVFSCMPVNNVEADIIKALFKKYCIQLGINNYYVKNEDLQSFVNELSDFEILFLDNTDKSLMLIKGINDGSKSKKAKYSYKLNGIEIYYDSNNYIQLVTKKPDFTIKTIEPVPCCFYDKEQQIYSLFFDYSGIKIPYVDKRLSVIANDTVYLRNYIFETQIVERMLKANFVKLSQCKFLYSGKLYQQHVNQLLLENGIMLEDDENVIIPQIRISKNESGWFDIDLSVDLNGEVISLASRMNLFATKNEIEINGKKILLPDSIIDAKDDLVVDGGKLSINQSNIFHLLHIIYDSQASVTDYFEYSKVTLDLPKKTYKIAFPYQLEGIKWFKFMFLNHFGGCLADDMGLGKTFQLISFLCDLEIRNKLDKVLIVVPKSLLTNWVKEFEKYSTGFRVGIYHGDSRKEFDFKNYDVIITTYNTAHLDLKVINNHHYSLTVFDEIQTIKNHKSITSESMKQIRSDVKYGLSGTPMENSISELWNIMDILNPDVFGSHASFMLRYNGKNYNELKAILNLFLMRRMKNDVLKELPPKTDQVIYCDMDSAQRNLYTGISVAVKNAIMDLKAFAAPVVLKGLTLLRECCCHPLLLSDETNVNHVTESCKLDALMLLVDNLYESGHKMLIFSNYTSMLHIIQKELQNNEKYKDVIYYLDGKTKNRSELVNAFEESDNGIFLISIKAGGVGLNLVSAQDVIIYDPWWNPFTEQQAIDRAYRIGQDKPVNVYKLVVANTLEERIIEMQSDKLQDFDELINGVSTDKNISLETIMKLL